MSMIVFSAVSGHFKLEPIWPIESEIQYIFVIPVARGVSRFSSMKIQWTRTDPSLYCWDQIFQSEEFCLHQIKAKCHEILIKWQLAFPTRTVPQRCENLHLQDQKKKDQQKQKYVIITWRHSWQTVQVSYKI